MTEEISSNYHLYQKYRNLETLFMEKDRKKKKKKKKFEVNQKWSLHQEIKKSQNNN